MNSKKITGFFSVLFIIILTVSCNNTKKVTEKIHGRFYLEFSGNADERDYAYLQYHPEVFNYFIL